MLKFLLFGKCLRKFPLSWWFLLFSNYGWGSRSKAGEAQKDKRELSFILCLCSYSKLWKKGLFFPPPQLTYEKNWCRHISYYTIKQFLVVFTFSQWLRNYDMVFQWKIPISGIRREMGTNCPNLVLSLLSVSNYFWLSVHFWKIAPFFFANINL